MRQGGFTLLESVVALAIAGLALAALTSGASGGLRAARVAAHTQDALARARSRMAGLAVAVQPGEQAGDDGGGFTWRVRAQPALVAEGGRAALYDVVVAVAWDMDGARREVALATRRLGPAPGGAP